MTGSSAAVGSSTLMRRIRSLCCARTASGHSARPPSVPINWRRLIAALGLRTGILRLKLENRK